MTAAADAPHDPYPVNCFCCPNPRVKSPSLHRSGPQSTNPRAPQTKKISTNSTNGKSTSSSSTPTHRYDYHAHGGRRVNKVADEQNNPTNQNSKRIRTADPATPNQSQNQTQNFKKSSYKTAQGQAHTPTGTVARRRRSASGDRIWWRWEEVRRRAAGGN